MLQVIKSEIVLWTAGFVLMTLLINVPLLPVILRKTGLSAGNQSNLVLTYQSFSVLAPALIQAQLKLPKIRELPRYNSYAKLTLALMGTVQVPFSFWLELDNTSTEHKLCPGYAGHLELRRGLPDLLRLCSLGREAAHEEKSLTCLKYTHSSCYRQSQEGRG